MKKIKAILGLIMIAGLMAALTACGGSKTEESTVAEGMEGAVVGDILSQTTQAENLFETDRTYEIPADAPTGVDGGPGMMETQPVTINQNYPEDKQHGEALPEGTMVCLYAAANYGIYQLFEYVDVCDADSLIAAMIYDDIVEDGTEVVAFNNDGGDAVLELNSLVAGYDTASEEQIVTCVVNTFIENLGLNTLQLKVGSKDYGQRSFNEDFLTVK